LSDPVCMSIPAMRRLTAAGRAVALASVGRPERTATGATLPLADFEHRAAFLRRQLRAPVSPLLPLAALALLALAESTALGAVPARVHTGELLV
jgi:hypothetical protein